MLSTRVTDAIGGSDIAAIRGENPYKTALDVWKRIVLGEPEAPAGLAAAIGQAAEEAIINDWCMRHDVDRQRVERTVEISMAGEPHLRGELDALVRSERVGIDAKLVLSPGKFKEWGEPGTDYMPQSYLCQMGWYSLIADLAHMEVAAVMAGQARDYIYRREPDFEAALLDDARRFWRDHVETRTPPGVQTVGDALWLHPAPKSDVRPATDAEAEIVRKWRDLRARVELTEKEVEAAKALVCAAIGDCDGLWLGGNDRVLWKANKNGIRSLKG